MSPSVCQTLGEDASNELGCSFRLLIDGLHNGGLINSWRFVSIG